MGEDEEAPSRHIPSRGRVRVAAHDVVQPVSIAHARVGACVRGRPTRARGLLAISPIPPSTREGTQHPTTSTCSVEKGPTRPPPGWFGLAIPWRHTTTKKRTNQII